MDDRERLKFLINSNYGAAVSEGHWLNTLNREPDEVRTLSLSVGGRISVGSFNSDSLEWEEFDVEVDAEEIVRELQEGTKKRYSVGFRDDPQDRSYEEYE